MQRSAGMLNQSSGRFAFLFASALLFGTAACDDNNNSAQDGTVEIDEGRARGDTLANMATQDLGGLSEISTLAIAADIMITIDEGEIMQAQLALERVSRPDIRDFATMMIDMHTAHAQMVTAQLAGLGASPMDNRVSASLRAESQAALADLSASSDPDATYIRMQITMHEEAFILVGSLGTRVTNAAFAALIADTQAVIAVHRDEAIALLRML